VHRGQLGSRRLSHVHIQRLGLADVSTYRAKQVIARLLAWLGSC
jgi:hypothetical protein